MTTFIPFPQRHGFIVASRSIAFALIVIAGLASPPSHADPGDFAAMPGLWKIVTTPVDHDHRGKPIIEWHCIDEGADPWAAFATISIPPFDPCQRNEPHRGSTSLAWNVRCDGSTPVSGRGRADFDSAEHYTASMALQDRGDVVQIEGRRYAACTSPSD
ncbi:DUF3617 domain-containing protein [Rhodanobacter sp. Col0626]|uniref:DUF3617 domain-containing protein n=1 Tax=Rhodanobacter sp. Col0626 TaxID=3415679 RepID=UPI003CF0E4F2